MSTDATDLHRSDGSHARPIRRRRHRLSSPDRRALERAGWRTLLDYREDHVRGTDGRLLSVASCWTAEAEHPSGAVVAATVVAGSPDAAWFRLRAAVRARGYERPEADRS